MCITGQVADPTTPGVWWRDDRKWRRYEITQADVIKEGVNNGKKWVILDGVRNCLSGSREMYAVDLRIMQQKSPRGFMRPVLIVDGAGAEGGPGEVQDGQALAANECPPFLRIWQRGSGSSGWELIPDFAARFLLRVAKSGASKCLLDEGNGSFSMVDLPSMTKDDTVMGRTSEMRIACPLDAAGIAAAIASAEHSQKKLVLHELVEALRAPEQIEELVKGDGVKGLELVGQRPNPYLDRESAQYQRFLDTLARHIHDLKEILVNECGQKRARALLPMEHVFHGTPPQNLDSILRGGMDPALRRKGHDYFAAAPERSLQYTEPHACGFLGPSWPNGPEGPQKLLVFLVLTLPVGFCCKEGKDANVVMHKVEYELPIFEVTVRRK